MGTARINNIKKLHNKVIHTPGPSELRCTEAEYLREDRIIKTLNDYVLEQVCPKCFPIREKMPVYPHRATEKYDIRYPKIYKIIENDLPTK